MSEKILFKSRLYFTGIVTTAIWILLGWNHYHGGVPSHHILAKEELPEISNWWGGLLLPILSWLLSYRIQRRIIRHHVGNLETLKYPIQVIYGFAGSLLFGALLSVFFTLGYSGIPGNMMLGLILFSLFFPIYLSECLLGFVISMTFTFGAVLPTGIGSILALVGSMLYLFVRPAILYLALKLARK
jgi:hypothetical protein